MSSLPLGRIVSLVTSPARDAQSKVAAEIISSHVGHLNADPTSFEATDEGTAFQRGDVLFGKLRPYLAKVWRADRAGAAIGDLHVYRPSAAVDSVYLAYYLLSPKFIEQVTASTFGAKMPRASWDFIKTIRVSVPPLSEQQAIADFLDRETAQIDTLIEKQTKLITLLQERRENLIWQAVTGGLASRTTKRSTSLPWIQDLPSDWQLPKISHDFSVILGKMLDTNRTAAADDIERPYIRAANIQDWGLSLQNVNTMPFRPYELARLSLKCGDLLVVEGGSVGTVHLLKEDMPGWSFQKTVNRIRQSSNRSSTHFLAYVIMGYRARGVISLISDGSTIAHLTAEKLKALRIPRPPLAEQREIADYLDRETAKIDTLIAKTERMIELSRERRSALITAAVTGQIDVTKEA